MDQTESHVASFLKHLGYGNVQYEPNGNVPPDFLVDRQIAVEVRRLNQAIELKGEVTGLETAAISLQRNIRSVIRSFETESAGTTWFVFYTFSRPVPPWRKLRGMLTAALRNFVQAPPADNTLELELEPGLALRFQRSSKAFSTYFVLGGFIDEESGGWLIAEMAKWLQYYIDEKTEKVRSYRNQYSEWWLVLVDYIGYGLDRDDEEIFREQANIFHDWDKLIVVSPRDYDRYFEIPAQDRR